MHPRVERALLLLEQSRTELAEGELRQALADAPNDSMAHSVLALCLNEQDKFAEAAGEAQQAIHLDPEQPFGYYALSIVQHSRNRFAEAEEAIRQAIALDSTSPTFFARLSQLHLDQRRWKPALSAAEEGLKLDPENVDCTNLRAIALVQLGSTHDAGAAIATALARDPEDATTHANMGWTLLQQGQHEQALHHFREALRLNPELEWARQGIVRSLQSRHLIYRLMLRYFLWMMKLSRGAQWGIMLGGYFAVRVLDNLAARNPQLLPWVLPIIIAYIAFALMTWIAGPLFNLLLRLNRFGRLVLSDEEITTANWIGVCLLGAVVSLVCFFVWESGIFLIAAAVCGLLVPSLSRIYDCSPGWPRTAMVAIAVSLLALGTATIFFETMAEMQASVQLAAYGAQCLTLFILGAIGSQFAANALIGVRPKR